MKYFMTDPNTFSFNRIVWPYDKKLVSSAWEGLEDYIFSIIDHCHVNLNNALEFGVDRGYSLHVFSKLFKKVIGVDAFVGDIHIIHQQGEEFYNSVKNSFNNTNVTIIRSLFQDFIKQDNSFYDLIHIDIVHEYVPTYECADWAMQHSNLVLLHDTISFPDIYKVCEDVAAKHNVLFLNIPHCHGLGILYRPVVNNSN